MRASGIHQGFEEMIARVFSPLIQSRIYSFFFFFFQSVFVEGLWS